MNILARVAFATIALAIASIARDASAQDSTAAAADSQVPSIWTSVAVGAATGPNDLRAGTAATLWGARNRLVVGGADSCAVQGI
jgi:hypothetical protein